MDNFDFILVGTGFATSFFLHELLAKSSPNIKILVLEKGKDLPYSWKIKNQSNTSHNFGNDFENSTPQKGWVQNIAFGGGSCWTGNTPRIHPSDMTLKTKYGISEDWPFSYDEFDPYLSEVESLMGISGPPTRTYPMKQPYPLPNHRLNALDRLLQSKYGSDAHFPMPSARSSSIQSGRPICCTNGVCSICPIGSKFQIDLHFRHLYEDSRVTLLTDADVTSIETTGNTVHSVNYIVSQKHQSSSANFIAIGAHAIATPGILLNSGFDDPALGRYLNEQISVDVRVNLDGVENYDGSQRVSGMGIMFLDHAQRAETPGCIIESYNIPWLRAEYGKWRHVGLLKFVFEDIPQYENKVFLTSDNTLSTYYPKYSEYMKKGLESVERRTEELLSGLPVEDFVVSNHPTNSLGGSAHIQGTTRMGTNLENSVVDHNLIHHRYRNLAILGSGVFPSCPAANPTLLLSALSIRSARSLF